MSRNRIRFLDAVKEKSHDPKVSTQSLISYFPAKIIWDDSVYKVNTSVLSLCVL